jgi:hypothetical protein
MTAGLSLVHEMKLNGDKMAQGMATEHAQWDGMGTGD